MVRTRVSGRRRGQGRGAAVQPRDPLGDGARRSAPRVYGRQSVGARVNFARRGSEGGDCRCRECARSGPARHAHRPRARGHQRLDSAHVLGAKEEASDVGGHRLCDLTNKSACGVNYTNEAGTTFDDLNGHGTQSMLSRATTTPTGLRHRQRQQPLPGSGPRRRELQQPLVFFFPTRAPRRPGSGGRGSCSRAGGCGLCHRSSASA